MRDLEKENPLGFVHSPAVIRAVKDDPAFAVEFLETLCFDIDAAALSDAIKSARLGVGYGIAKTLREVADVCDANDPDGHEADDLIEVLNSEVLLPI